MRVPRIVLVAGMEPSAFTCTPASMLEVRGRERDEEKTTRSRNLSEETGEAQNSKLSSRAESIQLAPLRVSRSITSRRHQHET